MSVSLPLDKMSISEKIRLMEEIWTALASNPGDYISPDWHSEVLRDRREILESNGAVTKEWQIAKNDILDSIK